MGWEGLIRSDPPVQRREIGGSIMEMAERVAFFKQPASAQIRETLGTLRPLVMSRISTMTNALRLVIFCCVFIMAHLFPLLECIGIYRYISVSFEAR